MSALRMDVANHNGIVADRKQICVQIPKSSEAGIDFSIINLNLSKLLESKLNTVIKNCIANCTWGRVRTPFESQYNNDFILDEAWRVNQDAFYQISLANWTDHWYKICYRWNEPFEHPYTVKWSPIWCIQIPDKINRSRYEWAWSIKRMWYGDPDPGHPIDEENVEIPSPEYSQLMNCTTILNCTTGARNPIETWYIPEL
ncbi:hypothetical protein QYF61_000825 [Mycteria americana]|uniref:Uncharacterized protein n=1 Tax=Mycteria americana TaxID=33587 RepID=A0AAN7RV68_MYCAM|nr:hypothetical protein QYF61_000825 [Mycteria americana]